MEIPEDQHPVGPPSGLRCPTIFLAALAAGATHFLTGDARHYGAQFGATVAGVSRCTSADSRRVTGKDHPESDLDLAVLPSPGAEVPRG